MVTFENTVVIDRPLSDVFDFIAGFENMPRWNYFVSRVTNVSGGHGIGTVYHQERKTDSQRYVVTEYEPDRRVTVKTLAPARALEMRFTFEPVGQRTRLIDRWNVDLGLPGAVEKVAAWRVRSAVAQNLAKLKELLEQGTVELQDGRRSTLASSAIPSTPGS